LAVGWHLVLGSVFAIPADCGEKTPGAEAMALPHGSILLVEDHALNAKLTTAGLLKGQGAAN
jgi:hypothetical protein